MGTQGQLRRWFSQLLPQSQSASSKAAQHIGIQPESPQDRLTSQNVSQVKVSIDRPEPAISKDGGHSPVVQSLARQPTDADLDTLEWGQKLSGPTENSTGGHGVHEDIESCPGSGRASPIHVDDTQAIVHQLPSVKQPYMNRWRVAACCIAFFIQGVNDSAPGALLPYMERYYNIRYAMVSLIFVANALGFIIAAPFCHKLNNKFGRAKVLSACTCLNVVAYTALVCQPPFAVVVIAFLFLGQFFEHVNRSNADRLSHRLRIRNDTSS